MLKYEGKLERESTKTKYTKSTPRKWTEDEENWLVKQKMGGTLIKN